MSVRLKLNSNEILHINNAYFRWLTSKIEERLNKKKINLSPEFENLLERFEVAGSGIGFDISNYITDRRDFLLLSELIDEIWLLETELPEEVVEMLNKLSKGLKTYEHSIPQKK